MATEFIIYTDESSDCGPYYSNFYGGALVRSTDLREVIDSLQGKKTELNLHREVKWQKVTENYLQKYIDLVDAFFDLVAADKAKVRIMFTKDSAIPTGLQNYHLEHSYHLLYYQFIKHAFGLRYAHDGRGRRVVRIYIDNMPDTKEKNALFKSHLVALSQSAEFRRASLEIRSDQIAEVHSHDHVVMQLLDIVLGAIQFKLNDKDRRLDPATGKRGSRTKAKAKLYNHIRTRIQGIYPNFNIGISTGKAEGWEDLWRHPYRHWCFEPKAVVYDSSRTKRK